MHNDTYNIPEDKQGYAEKKEPAEVPYFDDTLAVYAASSSAGQIHVTAAAKQGPTGPRAPFRSNSVFNPTITQRLNHVSLFSKSNTISGAYLIDPLLPASPVATSIFAGNTFRKINRENSRITGTGTGFGDQHNVPGMNAAFRTRHSAINIEVAIVGADPVYAPPGMIQQARAMASSHHGNISVNIFEIQEGRCIDLHVSTRSGNIVVLLPPNFAGPITIRQRRGHDTLSFLPAFAGRAHVLHTSEHETVVALSAATSVLQGPSAIIENDTCVVGTRAGKVTIGISGLDRVDNLAKDGSGLFDLLGECVQIGVQMLEDVLMRRSRIYGSIQQRYMK